MKKLLLSPTVIIIISLCYISVAMPQNIDVTVNSDGNLFSPEEKVLLQGPGSIWADIVESVQVDEKKQEIRLAVGEDISATIADLLEKKGVTYFKGARIIIKTPLAYFELPPNIDINLVTLKIERGKVELIVKTNNTLPIVAQKTSMNYKRLALTLPSGIKIRPIAAPSVDIVDTNSFNIIEINNEQIVREKQPGQS